MQEIISLINQSPLIFVLGSESLLKESVLYSLVYFDNAFASVINVLIETCQSFSSASRYWSNLRRIWGEISSFKRHVRCYVEINGIYPRAAFNSGKHFMPVWIKFVCFIQPVNAQKCYYIKKRWPFLFLCGLLLCLSFIWALVIVLFPLV